MNQEKKRIIIVDDDKLILDGFKQSLELEGYVVDTAETGREALEKSNVNFYNVALIDIRLPDMEGTKLLNAMKQTTPEMIKIILTGYPALQNAIDAVNKGADCYMVKPINMDELLRTVEEQLKKQSESKEYSQQRLAQYVETRIKELNTAESDTPKTTKKERL